MAGIARFTYRVAVTVDEEIAGDFLNWLGPHREEVVATGCFVSSTMHLVHTVDGEKVESGKATYVIDYAFISLEDMDTYVAEHAARLRGDLPSSFSGHMSATRQVLERQ